MCETTDLIKKLAHEGKSKTEIQKAIGVSRRSFNDIIDAIGPITFYRGPTYTVRGFHGTIQQIISHFNLNITERTVRFRMADFYSLEESFFSQKYGRQDEVRGFKGSTIDIIKHFGLTITADRVYKRMKAGVPVEDAYFGPINTSQARVRVLSKAA